MITTQQESTFTGGSESQQTTQQIGLGVLKDTVTVSILTSVNTHLSLNILSQPKVIHENTVDSDGYDIENKSPQIRLKKVTRYTSNNSDASVDGEELNQFLFGETPSSISDYWIWDMIMHTLVVRFFEIWGKGKISDIYRGIQGDSNNFQLSISGMVGGHLYGKGVSKNKKGEFFPEKWGRIYPEVVRWPTEGIEIAKKLAYLIADKNSK